MYSTLSTSINSRWTPYFVGLIGVFIFSFISLRVYTGTTVGSQSLFLTLLFIPALVLVASLLLARSNRLYGAMIFQLLAILSVFFTYADFLSLVLITVPLFICAELLFYNWFKVSSEFRLPRSVTV